MGAAIDEEDYLVDRGNNRDKENNNNANITGLFEIHANENDLYEEVTLATKNKKKLSKIKLG